eukprot:2666067-Alexandrium_andersonii.AAC.1
MSASLVGSEMCIRDRGEVAPARPLGQMALSAPQHSANVGFRNCQGLVRGCLLYTSDAADDM